ncbi:MAG: prepilin peptidase [Lentisphaerae bacterium]|nr:prepilin peptidase [Lentisphaerota bacterium]
MTIALPEWTNSYITVLIFFLGACLGSFANVCIYRMPRGGSVIVPRSRCPHCQQPIAWYDNIPLFSFLGLRAQCRHCRGRIAFQYFLVELLMAVLFLVIWLKFGLEARTPIYWLMAGGLVIGAFIDFEFMILPDRLTVGGMVIGPILSALAPALQGQSTAYLGFCASVGALTLGAAFLWLVATLGTLAFRKEAMGMGDVKLLGALGAFLGWKAVFFTIVGASLAGALVGVTLILARRKTMASKLPFGPYLALAALVWILGGSDWWAAYTAWVARGL